MDWLKKLAGKVAGPLIGGLFGYGGQKRANETNVKLAREQMYFQERMSNTAYQRAAKDLDAAGLNRILALGSPASSPGGQTATMQNEGAAGVAGAAAAQTMKLQKQEMKNKRAEEDLIRQQEWLTNWQASSAKYQAMQGRMYTEWMNDERGKGNYARNAWDLWDSLKNQNVAQASLQNAMVPQAQNAADYYKSKVGTGLQWFGMGAKDMGPAVIGATGAGAATALVKRRMERQFRQMFGKGLSQ